MYGEDFYIFTDGSYHKEKKKEKYMKKINDKINMISKFGIYFGMKCINISHKEDNSTINQCELLAIKYALLVLDNYKKHIKIYQKENPSNIINIVSDSQYCIKALMLWMDNWLKNNWKTQLDEPVKNKEIFISINLLMSKLKLHKIRYKFIHVNSHRPPPLSNPKEMFLWKGNQLADYLAKDYIC
jgi:ribonuclease HI